MILWWRPGLVLLFLSISKVTVSLSGAIRTAAGFDEQNKLFILDLRISDRSGFNFSSQLSNPPPPPSSPQTQKQRNILGRNKRQYKDAS